MPNSNIEIRNMKSETAALRQETTSGTRDYCVAIRTLGTAGEKYQTLLECLVAQTLPPKKILVYIPHGYPAPKETVGIEQIVRCEKGMVTQRSLSYKEVDTDYILFCDDDVSLKQDSVAKLFDSLIQYNGDCVAASVFFKRNESLWEIIKSFVHSHTYLHHNKKWFSIIRKDGAFSYRRNPTEEVMETQSAPFPCFLCKTIVYHSLHFEDERWLDQFKYASRDDQLFFYKMYIMGFRVLIHMNSGVVHMDARAAKRPDNSLKYYMQKKIGFIIWYRTIFKISNNTLCDKVWAILSFSKLLFFDFLFLPFEILYYKKLRYLIDFFTSIWSGIIYVHSKEYKKIPTFDAYMS